MHGLNAQIEMCVSKTFNGGQFGQKICLNLKSMKNLSSYQALSLNIVNIDAY